MRDHIAFMEVFLAGLRSLPNPDLVTQAYIRAFEVCLHSAKRNKQKEVTLAKYVELPSIISEERN